MDVRFGQCKGCWDEVLCFDGYCSECWRINADLGPYPGAAIRDAYAAWYASAAGAVDRQLMSEQVLSELALEKADAELPDDLSS
jgi:hypothetical protein